MLTRAPRGGCGRSRTGGGVLGPGLVTSGQVVDLVAGGEPQRGQPQRAARPQQPGQHRQHPQHVTGGRGSPGQRPALGH